MATAEEKDVKTQLRMPAQLAEAIKRLAVDERRSMNAQIVKLLEDAIDAIEIRKRQGYVYPNLMSDTSIEIRQDRALFRFY